MLLEMVSFLRNNYCLLAATATTVVIAATSAAVVAKTTGVVIAAAREQENKNDNPAAAISAKVKSAHSVPPIRSGCEVFRFPLRRSLHSSYYAVGGFSLLFFISFAPSTRIIEKSGNKDSKNAVRGMNGAFRYDWRIGFAFFLLLSFYHKLNKKSIIITKL